MWNDALRVAKFHGGQSAHKRVAYAWALALGGDAGAKLLNKQVCLLLLPCRSSSRAENDTRYFSDENNDSSRE